MKTNKIDHICIAVRPGCSKESMGAHPGRSEPDDPYIDEPEKIRVARYWLGGIGFELMESTTPMARRKMDRKKWRRRDDHQLHVDNTREAIRSWS